MHHYLPIFVQNPKIPGVASSAPPAPLHPKDIIFALEVVRIHLSTVYYVERCSGSQSYQPDR